VSNPPLETVVLMLRPPDRTVSLSPLESVSPLTMSPEETTVLVVIAIPFI
jgi:hypothetical protein